MAKEKPLGTVDLKSGLDNFLKNRNKLKRKIGQKEKPIDLAAASQNENNLKNSIDVASSSKIVHALPPAKKKKLTCSSNNESSNVKKHKSCYEVYQERCSLIEFEKFWKEYASNNLTQIELDQFGLSVDQFVQFANNAKIEPNEFLKEKISDWPIWLNQKDLLPGSPFVLVICGSAVRAVNLNRLLDKFKTAKCKCAKLFAKHMKIKDQQAFLKQKVVHFAIGTPQRIAELISTDCLRLNNLLYLIIDWSDMDVKKRRLIDYPYIRDQLFNLLYKFLRDPIAKNDLKAIIM